jgi:quercetin dioxygenase-like cupin family protein
MTSTTTLPEPVETSLGFRGRFVPSDDPNVLIGETWAAPGGGAGPLHRHLHQSERFEVLEGAITVRLGRTAHVVSAGESFHIPAGAPHTFVNHTDEEAHFKAYFSPPMRLEGLFTELAGYDGRPTLGQTARLMADYRHEFFYLARIPVRAQRALGRLAEVVIDARRALDQKLVARRQP